MDSIWFLLSSMDWRKSQPQKAKISRTWMLADAVFLGIYFIISCFANPGAFLYVGLAILGAWYWTQARPQVKYVRQQFGNDYPRKPIVKGGLDRTWRVPRLSAVRSQPVDGA